MKHLINMTSMLGSRNVLNLFRITSTTSSSSSFSTVAKKLDVSLTSVNSCCEQQTRRTYAAKKSAQLTEAQIQFQKHTAELGFKEKTSIRGTLYEFHDVETSIKYMQSEAFKTAYGDKLIWQWYIRNHKGRFPRLLTREKCIGTDGRYTTGNPCPVCRDPYLVVNFRNSDLLRHFVSPDTGYLLPARVTNVCRKTQENLLVAYEKACDHGLIEHPIPHRHYDYSIYNPHEKKKTRSEGEAVDEQERPSVLLGVILGANRKKINKIYDELNEEDISLGIKAKNE